ncbi:hypothetical protein MMC28_006024 [Mycoblastus sanguinarius]|nr:hypothetical protein [Mycoblastus sanguinarius]
MALTTIIALALLFQRHDAGPVPSPNNNRPCVEFNLPVSATAQNAEYDIIRVQNDIDATAFTVDLDTWSSPTPGQRLLQNITVSDTFDISVQLCVPPNGMKNNHLQIASHGVAFDKRYWDAAVNPSEYSYVDAALTAGYSILTYDRLGTGLSDKPDGDTIVQAPLQLEILRGITQMARSGDLLKHAVGTENGTVPETTSNHSIVAFDKIIHVGHSFGSFLTSALLTTYGNLSDAAIITGYDMNPHFVELRWTSAGLEYAPQNNATLFGDRSAGYMVGGTRAAIQTSFFSTQANATTGIGGFEEEVLDYAFSIRQTVTGAEIVSSSQLNLGAAESFEGPVQIVLGEFDYVVCRGNCNEAINLDSLKSLYPKAEDIYPFTQPGTGHGLTMHRGAQLGYKASLDWLERKGL